jgi:hypothetical protein
MLLSGAEDTLFTELRLKSVVKVVKFADEPFLRM